ncbi:MAG: RNA-binding S4 domain-containing protein [Pseudomonadota bacterium]
MNPASDRVEHAPGAAQRLDKWLWFARIAKTRTLAAALVSAGKIRVNRKRVDKPSQAVRPGDVLTASLGRAVRIIRVIEPGTRRGPASEAQRLYEELTPAADATKPQPGFDGPSGAAAARLGAAGERPKGAGRPTKRDRRRIGRFSGSLDDD